MGGAARMRDETEPRCVDIQILARYLCVNPRSAGASTWTDRSVKPSRVLGVRRPVQIQ
jgi:hypothetical protein